LIETLQEIITSLCLLCDSETHDKSQFQLMANINFLVCDVFAPSPGGPAVKFTLPYNTFQLGFPNKDLLPYVDIKLSKLFSFLSINNVIKSLSALLLEQRVLLVSTKVR